MYSWPTLEPEPAEIAPLMANNIIPIQRRRTRQVVVNPHDHTGPFDRLPERRRHFQNLFGRIGLLYPGADLVVLIGGQQRQVQHFVNGFHGWSGSKGQRVWW